MVETPPAGSLFGMPIYYSPAMKRGEVLIADDPANPLPGRAAKVVLVKDWAGAKMLEFDHDLWWSETPAESARRIVLEVLEHHGIDPAEVLTAPEATDG